MTEIIKPTRSELLRTRKRVKLAKKGHELLKKKQDSLILELFRLVKEVKAQRETLQARYVAAIRRMNEARALSSDLTVKAAALAARAEPVRVEVRNIAGVRIPDIARVAADRQRPVFDTLTLQEVGVAYTQVLDDILALAAKETALRKILIEIKKTKRRAYALEHILIPRLEAATHHITFELEERGREEFTRLKMRKR